MCSSCLSSTAPSITEQVKRSASITMLRKGTIYLSNIQLKKLFLHKCCWVVSEIKTIVFRFIHLGINSWNFLLEFLWFPFIVFRQLLLHHLRCLLQKQ
uniref:Uncharacterized protein n=1 Tax=Triticum urartu TaxID=4572 RepID=A0A8R7NY77_TRIUA